jgi:hypothetical protein
MGILEKLFSEEELNQFRIYEGINWKKALKYGALIGGATAAGVALHDYLVKKAAEDAAETIRKHQEQQGKEFAKKGHEYLDKASEEYDKIPKIQDYVLYKRPIDIAIQKYCRDNLTTECIEKHKNDIEKLSKNIFDAIMKQDLQKLKELGVLVNEKDISKLKLSSAISNVGKVGPFDNYIEPYLKKVEHYLNAKKYDELAYVYHSAADDAQREVEKAKREFQKQTEQDMYSYKIKNALLSLARKLGF